MLEKIKNINYKKLFIIFIVYGFAFQLFIQNYISIFKYFDEVLSLIALFFLPIIVIKKNSGVKNNLQNKYRKIFILYAVIILIGLLSNLIFRYQSFFTVLCDVIVFCKFLLVMYLSSIVIDKKIIIRYKDDLLLHSNIISWIFIVFTILNYIFKYNPGAVRMGIMSNQIFYLHPTHLAAATIFLIVLRIILKNKNFDYINIFLFIILLSTLRFKAIGAAVIALLIAIYVDKSNKRISMKKLAIFALIVFCICFNQIKFYFFNGDYARSKLLTTSVEIAIDHFPMGTGFATYGSYFSAVNYSPIYNIYKLDGVYGLSEGRSHFVSDCFWPMILGQFGFIGLLLYVIVILLIFKNIQNEYSKVNKYIYISKIISFMYLLICSTSESAFVNPVSIPLALIIGLNLNSSQVLKENNEIDIIKFLNDGKNKIKLLLKKN